MQEDEEGGSRLYLQQQRIFSNIVISLMRYNVCSWFLSKAV